MPTLRIYCETLPFEDVTRPSTLRLLQRYGLELVLAVRPWQLGELPAVGVALRDAGIPLSIWPMLADEDGRWANAQNAEVFASFTLRTCEVLAKAGAAPGDVLLDLEPSFHRAKALVAHVASEGIGRFAVSVARRSAESARAAITQPASRRTTSGSVRGPVLRDAESTFARTMATLEAEGITTSMAVWPVVALDPPAERRWQALLGTPVDGLASPHVSVMLYTSILEGWSRGTLARKHVLGFLAAGTARALRRWGSHAGISLGCVGTGAFEDEPIYRTPNELAEDAAVARASGCAKLSLFDLGGVLARPPPEAWLDAFCHDGHAVAAVVRSHRVEAVRRFARIATYALRRPR